jgi:acetyltransferase-like isoleucine patch superfamily enzyme
MRLEHDWFDAEVPAGVEIGEGSWLHSSFAFRHHRGRAVRIGSHSGVYRGSGFNTGPDAEVEIGDWTTIVGAIFATNAQVTIGDYVFVAHEVVFADGPFAQPGGDVGGTARDVVVGDGAWIGMRAVLLGGAVIGEDAVVGAGTVVDFEVPAGCTVAGNPPRVFEP